LGEDDFWFAHGEYLSDPLVRIPLLMRVPGRPPEQRNDVAAAIDLLPTLIGALGAEPLEEPGGGRDLLAPNAAERASRPYFSALASAGHLRYGIVDGEFRFVITEQDGIGRGELYRRGHDGADLAAAAPQIAGPLRKRLTRVRAHVLEAQREERLQELSTADRLQLRALGYVDDPPGADPEP
jgi:arylsulfatase A-like enzyme